MGKPAVIVRVRRPGRRKEDGWICDRSCSKEERRDLESRWR
jgi:hypothetical protein